MARVLGNERIAAALVATFAIVVLIGAISSADASRKPTEREKTGIRKALMADCRKSQDASKRYPCRWQGDVRVSTANTNYAWGSAIGPAYDNSGLLKKSSGRRWRVLQVVGGGIQPCSYWREKAPRKVVSDLGIRGYSENSGNFDYHDCRPDPDAAAARGVASAEDIASSRANQPVMVECLGRSGAEFRKHPSACNLYEHGSPGSTILRSMRWKHWGGARATGAGRIAFFDHPDYNGRVKVALTKIFRGHCVKGRFYTRAKVRVTSGYSEGHDFKLQLGAGCPA